MTCRSDALKTYDRVAPMAGLAVMALKRAFDKNWDYPPMRACGCQYCQRYFAIIDRVTRGEP